MALNNRNRLYINGEWVAASEKVVVDVINPATEESIGQVPVGSASDIDRAIGAARQAFDSGPWPRVGMRARIATMQAFHAYLLEHKAEIVDLIVSEAGATQTIAEFLQFNIPMKHCLTLLDEASRIQPGMIPTELTPAANGTKVLGTGVIQHDPVGVVTGITPYNFPFFLNITKVFHALVMGNTMVLKPSPLTPFQALLLGDAADACGLPKGVLNIVTGDVAAGTLLTTDRRVDMVTFTGSDQVGTAIMAQAAPTLKKVHLELGGKSALIVRHDANLKAAVPAGLAGFTIHSGQGCALTTRHLVHNSIRKAYVEEMAAMAQHLKIGNPVDPAVTFGPLINAAARARAERYVDEGVSCGARLVTGGRRPDQLDRGFYFQPTIFDDVDNGSRIAQEEIFGPVAVVIGFDTDEEAIALANDSEFGLHGAVYSADAGRAYEVALQLRTGGVAINGGGGTMLSSSPFGGIKRSGLGREYGREGLLEFTQSKSISFRAA